MSKILWLASWFPNDNDPLVGDFIKRHAEAVSLYQPVHVIHVERIADRSKTKTVETTDATFPDLCFTLKYYVVIPLLGIERSFSYLYSLWLYHSLVKKYIRVHGKPALIHVHI